MYNRERRNKDFKQLNKIAGPLIIQNIACMLIGMVDEIFVGHISPEAYAGVGLSVSLLNFIAGVFGYFAIAFNISGARKLGEKNEEEFRTLLVTSLLIDIVVGGIFAGVMIVFSRIIFHYAYGLSGIALKETVKYTLITCPCLLVQMIIFTMNSYFKILKRTNKIMVVSIGSALVNVGLDYVLIYGKAGFPELGVVGAAIATLISVSLNAVILLVFARHDIRFIASSIRVYVQRAKGLIKESIPLIGEELLEGSVFVVGINMIVSNMGILHAGGYILTKNLLELVMISMYMYGNAALTIASERYGERKLEDIRPLAGMGILISMVIYLALGTLMVVFRNQVPKIITDDKQLISFAAVIILPMVLANLFNPIQTIYKYILQACDDAKFVLYTTAAVNLASFVLMLCLQSLLEMFAVFVCLLLNYAVITAIYSDRIRKISEKTDEQQVESELVPLQQSET